MTPIACTLALALAGCASVKTLSETGAAPETRLRRPSHILVRPFSTSDGMWRGEVAHPARREEIRDWLTGSLLRHLSIVAPTHVLGPEDTPSSGWLVTGRFLHVNPGSRAGRLFLGGVGVGASRLETRVDVYDLAVSDTDPIFTFTTTGGSNFMAGVPGAMSGTDDDIDRTAREIRKHLEDHLWPAASEEGRPEAPPAMDPVPVGRERR